MENSKSIDVIIENYNTGQKKGRIFSYVITLTVTVGILFTVFFGINLISEKYFLTRQEVINKNAETEQIQSDTTANEVKSLNKILKKDDKLK